MENSQDLERIAIIGMSGRFPGARNVEQLWENLIAGKDCISRFREDELEFSVVSPEARASGTRSVAARGILEDVDQFDAAFFGIYPREAELMDPQHRIFLECAWESLESAGYNPQTFPGMIGVFAGVSLNTYLLFNLSSDGKFANQLAGNYQVGEYQAMLGNDKDFLPTRVSYKLNLKGPSMAIQTACSSSLVAICQACSSLLSYQSDMVLAGGVSITFPQKRDYLYEEDGMVSIDGTCRTFDSEAKGTVFGHGCAVVLLKRLSDAVKDGDNILAVIRGSAVNNDGSEKIGYAAPSIKAQAEVIAMAQAVADVEPSSISYIEAHGTGTPLGDPIEIAALMNAFRDGGATENGYCAIGTGKPNISHLDVAAGATGLIKTVMQLQHQQIPPLLNYKSPNPKIDFTNSPFFPVTKLLDWKRGEKPRRAGVSAFGVGGTNAHVVLEESPLRSPITAQQMPQLFPLSAKSEAALARIKESLIAKIDSDKNLDLADVAYTLQIGRKEFEYRSVVVASERDGLCAELKSPAGGVVSRKVPANTPKTVFLFPGQGSQYVDMGQDLYRDEAVFRQELNRCAEILKRHLKIDLCTILYPPDESARVEANKKIHETCVTQPAIFAVEYAIAKLWMSRGIQPDALIGHSIGEYVCAVISEAMSLEDALALLSLRATLMAALPSGSMLSVRLSAVEVEALLPDGVSIAAANSQKLCVVSGPTAILEAFSSELTSKNIASRLLATSHAFHSNMMDPILGEFTQACAKTNRKVPVIRWISTCTGREITAADMADAGYWSRQLRHPVLFSKAIDTLLEKTDDYVFIEVGPGRALNQFVRQHPAKVPGDYIVASLGQSEDGAGDSEASLMALGKLWSIGLTPKWESLHASQRRYRVPLPTYPFERKRFWVEPQKPKQHGGQDRSSRIQQDYAADSERGGKCDITPQANLSGCTQPMVEQTVVAAVSQGNRKERITQELKSIFLNLSGMPVDDSHSTFIDLGFDSLFLSQASQAIDAKFKIKITFRQLLGNLSTVEAIAEFLDEKLPSDVLSDVTPIAVVNEPSPIESMSPPAMLAASSSDQSQLNASDVQRMLAGHLKSIQQLLDRSQQQPSVTTASSSASGTLLAVKKPVEANANSPSKKPEESKRFGPYKPIEKGEKGGLTEVQQEALNRLIERYLKKTPGSKNYTAEHRPHFADPRAVAGFRSQWKEMVYPIVSARSKGSKIWDIDGNEYIDITMGFGTYFFGHSPDWLISAIEEQLQLGIEIGPQSPLAGKVAKMIAEFTGLERVTFCNTGSEAVMAAMRLARAVTGRNRIVYFAGDYHGMFEEVLVRGAWPNGEYRAQPIAPGIPPSLVENILVLDYGASESLEIIRKHGDEIAAVMVEPVQSRNPSLQPKAFMQQLRTITEEVGAALIFDEVVTGFRCHQGGAQAYFGVRADMATYGKVVGGGMPIGILAGIPKFMDALDGGQWQYGDDSFPEVGVTFFAGTFVRHPLAIAAAHAVLKFLQEAGPELQSSMTAKVERVCQTINSDMEQLQVPIRISSFSAFAYIDYAPDLKFASLLWYYLRAKGIHIWEGRPCYFTIAHSDQDLEQFTATFRECVEEMQRDGFLPKSDSMQLLPAVGQDKPHSFPVAEGQREMWLGAQMSPDAAGPHHACNAFVLEGEFDLEAIRKAIAMVIDRHEGLRSVFNSDGTEVVLQPNFSLEIPLVDLTKLSEQEQSIRVREIMEAEGRRIFDLATGPLLAVQVLRLSSTCHQMIITAQMIVCDGWSHYVIFEEISEIYSAIREQRDPTLRPVVPMREYARWQKDYWGTKQAEECERYWLSQFETIPDPIDLPTKGLRPLMRTVAADRRDIFFTEEFYEEIKRFGRTSKNSSFAVLLAAFQIWLHRLSGATDLVVGVPFSAQNALGFDTLVGQCANTLPIRTKLDPKETFQEVLTRTWNSLLDAQENPHYTFGRLIPQLDIRHDPSRIPLVSTIFNIDPALAKVKFSGLKHRFFAGPRFYYQFDLGFNLVEEEGGLRVECDFNTNLFDAEVIDQWLRSYELLLRDILGGSRHAIALMPMVERDTSLASSCFTSASSDTSSLKRWLENAIQQSPEAVAVRDESRTYTYCEVDRLSKDLIYRLSEIKSDVSLKVGVLAKHSADAWVVALSILRAGGTCIPIYSAFSRDQIDHVIGDAAIDVIVADDDLKLQVSHINCPIITAQFPSRPEVQAVQDWQPREVGSEQDAFLFYSPTTVGMPKGVGVTYGAVHNLLGSLRSELELTSNDRVVALSPLFSRFSLAEYLLPITVGAQCVVVDSATTINSVKFGERLTSDGITVMQSTPTLLRRLLGTGWKGSSSLKILVGGERIDRSLVDRLAECCGELWGLYSHTENKVWSSLKRLLPNEEVSLGKPILNTSLRVVDDCLQSVPVGVAGRLIISCVGGPRGFRNREELTQQGFLSQSSVKDNSVTSYLTNDYARQRLDGELVFVAHGESRVLLRGQQINLEEIESLIREFPEVTDAAVVLRDDLADELALAAYIFLSREKVSGVDKKQLSIQLRQQLRSKLPSQMVPAYFIFSSEVPLAFDWKLDRASLTPLPQDVVDLADDFVAPTSKTEQRLSAIWQDVLKLSKVGVNDNFFDLGGTSLLAVRVFQRITLEFDRKLPLSTLFRSPTIAQLAATLDSVGLSSQEGWTSLIPIQPKGDRKPLFLVHGAGGNVLLYQALAKRLAPRYPLYGLQSQGLDGESEPLKSIEEMAERYVREIRGVQPKGPYFLGGYCLGGTVAYEMAQQLRREGEEVALVAMLDTYNFSRALKSNFISFLLQKIRFHLGNFIQLRPSHMMSYLKEKIRVARDGELANLLTSRPGFDTEDAGGRATSGAELAVQTINDNAAEVYNPKPYPGRLTIFKPRINYKFYPDPKMGWGDLALEGLDIVEFPFNPHAMLVEPYVEQLADALIQRLAKIELPVELNGLDKNSSLNSERDRRECSVR
jgi:acyl transferase domain-containing protein/glutamate-1-semialdehyde aminotransferase/non-ribosomal peptide synthetase component F/thioesterase domain-containing protein